MEYYPEVKVIGYGGTSDVNTMIRAKLETEKHARLSRWSYVSL